MATVKSGQRQWYELLSGATPQGLVGGAGRQAAPGGEIITPHRFRSFISKKGNHRFFRRSCQEFGTDVVSEEMPDDNEVLSLGGQDPRHGRAGRLNKQSTGKHRITKPLKKQARDTYPLSPARLTLNTKVSILLLVQSTKHTPNFVAHLTTHRSSKTTEEIITQKPMSGRKTIEANS